MELRSKGTKLLEDEENVLMQVRSKDHDLKVSLVNEDDVVVLKPKRKREKKVRLHLNSFRKTYLKENLLETED